MKEPLENYQKSIYSQYGEDGIIEEICRRLGISNGHCVEFGAWDGIFLSNVYNLLKNKGWSGTLIEGNSKKFQKLKVNMKDFSQVSCLNKWIGFEENNSLETILKQQKVPPDFDVLSIDIDGVDFYVFESLSVYKPKVVIIEYNPTIPNEVEFVQAKTFSTSQGSSAKSIVKLAENKGYKPVFCTSCNLIFVLNTYYDLVCDYDVSLDELRDDSPYKVFLFVGYDGTVFTSQPVKLLWHGGITVDSSKLQVIPMLFRSFPDNKNMVLRKLQKVFLDWFVKKETKNR